MRDNIFNQFLSPITPHYEKLSFGETLRYTPYIEVRHLSLSYPLVGTLLNLAVAALDGINFVECFRSNITQFPGLNM